MEKSGLIKLIQYHSYVYISNKPEENNMDNIEKLLELDKKGEVNTPEAKELAQKVYDRGLALHPCYWNDRLYLALRFGLDEEKQKIAVKNSIIFNGINGYFEQITHCGFDTKKLLNEQGVPLELLPQQSRASAPGYHFLDKRVIKMMADKFGIDTEKTRPSPSSFNYYL